jgi:hypothetical protein
MLKISSNHYLKVAQNFMDELKDVDWGDDDQADDAPGFINNDNYNDYLADEMDEQPEGRPEIKPELAPQPTQQQPEQQPQEQTQYEEESYDSPQFLVNDGIENGELISFDYTTRHGIYAGYRTVEPHYTFISTNTGNEILVTFDRNYNDIRAFIVGNIHPYGVRYKGIKFQPKPEIMVGVQQT